MKQQKKSKGTHYVSNKQLYEEMVKYREKYNEAEALGVEPPRASNFIGEAIYLICNRLAFKPNFFSYTFRDEMIADGIENCVKSIKSFDHTKSQNPFAYFTQIAYNAFIRRILFEQKQTYLKYKNYQNIMIDVSLIDEEHIGGLSNEVSDKIIETFEEKNKSKKTKKLEEQAKIGIGVFFEEGNNSNDQK